MEAKAIFLNPFAVCSSCKRKFIVCPFADEETKESYPLVNGLYRLAMYVCKYIREYAYERAVA